MLNEILFPPRSVPLYEYLYSHYPPYCAGAFYFMNINVMNKLINLFEEEFGRNYLWIEDVFLTGMYLILKIVYYMFYISYYYILVVSCLCLMNFRFGIDRKGSIRGFVELTFFLDEWP